MACLPSLLYPQPDLAPAESTPGDHGASLAGDECALAHGRGPPASLLSVSGGPRSPRMVC